MGVITHNTVEMKAKDVCCTRTIFQQKSALRRERWKTKWWNWELFEWFVVFYISLSHVPLVLSPHVSPFISPSLTVSITSCTSACFYLGDDQWWPLCSARNGDIEADLKTLGSDETVSLSQPFRGGQGQTLGTALGSFWLMTRSGDWFCRGERMRWTRSQTNA